MTRFDLFVSAAFSVAWIAAILVLLGVVPVTGVATIDLYQLFSFAGALGWLSGNVYMWRRRLVTGPFDRRRLLVSYLTGPLALLLVLRALASAEAQRAAPLVPVYAACVFWLFFLVPVTLRSVPWRTRDDDSERS